MKRPYPDPAETCPSPFKGEAILAVTGGVAIMDTAQIKALVEKALEDKILTLEEHGQIIDAVLSDGQISEEEEKILQELLERVASGEIDSQY